MTSMMTLRLPVWPVLFCVSEWANAAVHLALLLVVTLFVIVLLVLAQPPKPPTS